MAGLRGVRTLVGGAGVVAALALSAAGPACTTSSVGPVPIDTSTVNGPEPYVPGTSYYGVNRFIEYVAGDIPIILSASHGGSIEPMSIPNRTADRCGGAATTVTDAHTRELTLAMAEAIRERFGAHPHVVINHLHRRKLDANRDLTEAACGNADAERAWREYHEFLEAARTQTVAEHGWGWYMDIHGHGHDHQRLELGYLLGRTALNSDDQTLAADDRFLLQSSIRTMVGSADALPAWLRGPASLGALYEGEGFPAVPSPTYPGPGDAPYFTGGYNTVRHGCGAAADRYGGHPGGPVCGVQVEANRIGVRDTQENRLRFAQATAAVLEAYLAGSLAPEPSLASRP